MYPGNISYLLSQEFHFTSRRQPQKTELEILWKIISGQMYDQFSVRKLPQKFHGFWYENTEDE